MEGEVGKGPATAHLYIIHLPPGCATRLMIRDRDNGTIAASRRRERTGSASGGSIASQSSA